MKDFDINEYYDINRDTASVRGFFFLKDEDGNILRTNENMILKSGRQLIMGRFIKPDNNTGYEKYVESDDIKKDTIYMRFGSDNSLSEPDMNGLKQFNNLIAKVDNKEDDYLIDYNKLYIKYTASITIDKEENATTIGEFGLALKAATSDDYKTITRVVFPLIHLNYGSTYKVEYYIYF